MSASDDPLMKPQQHSVSSSSSLSSAAATTPCAKKTTILDNLTMSSWPNSAVRPCSAWSHFTLVKYSGKEQGPRTECPGKLSVLEDASVPLPGSWITKVHREIKKHREQINKRGGESQLDLRRVNDGHVQLCLSMVWSPDMKPVGARVPSPTSADNNGNRIAVSANNLVASGLKLTGPRQQRSGRRLLWFVIVLESREARVREFLSALFGDALAARSTRTTEWILAPALRADV